VAALSERPLLDADRTYARYWLDYIERTMCESERSANGRDDFLKTLIAAPGVTAALVETTQATPPTYS
jgi:hypothetical protein